MPATLIRIRRSALEAIAAAGAGAYPHECCGALLGDSAGAREARRLLRAVPLPNGCEGAREHRYVIDADGFRRAEATAAASGVEFIGIYHSHPDAPAEPSRTDLANAWPWYTYVIVSVRDGIPADVRAWRLADDRTCFCEEEVWIEEGES